MLLGHIELHSSYRRQPKPIIYGENQSHAKWSYETGVTSRPFRPRLFGIIVDIKSSAKDLGDNGVDEYPNEQHDMVSGNYYNQLLSLREQMHKDVEESNMVTGLQSEVQGGPVKPFALASTILSKGWHPGYIEIGAFIEAVVELQRIDHLRKTPFTMYYNNEHGCLAYNLADTGLIVAGISVLNFFIHALFPLPLNTFCHIDHCLSVGIWYIAKEYTYRPQQGQQSTFQMDLIRVKELLRKSRSDDVDDTMDFQEVDILKYSAACLMNVFMHCAAYCLFPLLTLVNNIGLINSVDVTPSDQQQLHIIYFSRHGYTFFDMPLIAMTINPDTVLSFLCTCSVGNNIYESKFEYVIAPQLWDSMIAKLNILVRLEGQSLLLADMSILCSQVLSRPEVLEQTKKDPMWSTYHSVLTALFDTGGDIASDTAQDLFTLFFTITERYPGSTLTINNEASRPSTSPVPKVSLTLSIPDDVFKPEQQNGFEN
ncbi:hypothetical protein EV368DRAFT_63966 [Lentinula lateritia]|nr:hypothetical protein EV368DRAFT_63966 [Lentinula lateritia]